MNWYITKIVFNISSESHSAKNQFDEQLRLVSATDAEEAFYKARTIGLSEEDSFYNENLQRVNWEFVNVTEVLPLQQLGDGVEVYSRIHEAEEGSQYVRTAHQKAIAIRRKYAMAS
jgi:hypothetical protein